MEPEIQDQILEWLSRADFPGRETVTKLRKRLLLNGEKLLPRVLMAVEKNLANNCDDPLRPLRRFLRDGPENAIQTISLRIDQFEPFPSQRWKILENRLARLDGEILEKTAETVRVKLYSKENSQKLSLLYNWIEDSTEK